MTKEKLRTTKVFAKPGLDNQFKRFYHFESAGFVFQKVWCF